MTMKSRNRRSAHEYFAIASSIRYSTTMQKALDAVANMSDTPKQQVVTVPRIPSTDMTASGADAAGISPKEARRAYRAMIDAA